MLGTNLCFGWSQVEKELGKHQTYHQKRLFMQLKFIQIFFITPLSLTWPLKKAPSQKAKLPSKQHFWGVILNLKGVCMIEIESTVQIWKKWFKPLDLFRCFFALTVSSHEVATWSYWPFFSKYFTWWIKKQCRYATTVRSILCPVFNNTMYYHTALLKVRKQRILGCKRNH